MGIEIKFRFHVNGNDNGEISEKVAKLAKTLADSQKKVYRRTKNGSHIQNMSAGEIAAAAIANYSSRPDCDPRVLELLLNMPGAPGCGQRELKAPPKRKIRRLGPGDASVRPPKTWDGHGGPSGGDEDE